MERIVIEVDDRLAKAWKNASDAKRKSFGNKINVTLAKDFIDNGSSEYLDFLSQLRDEMKKNGLSQSDLDKILNDA